MFDEQRYSLDLAVYLADAAQADGRTPWRRRVLLVVEQLRASTFWRRLRMGERA